MCPKYFEKLLHGHFFGTNRLVVFYSCCNVGCQQSSHQKQQYHPAPRASGSVLFFSQTLAAARMHTGRGQSCHFRGHCQISANAGWCGSAPYNHPDVSNQLDFSNTPPPLSVLSVECHPLPLETFYESVWMRKSD